MRRVVLGDTEVTFVGAGVWSRDSHDVSSKDCVFWKSNFQSDGQLENRKMIDLFNSKGRLFSVQLEGGGLPNRCTNLEMYASLVGVTHTMDMGVRIRPTSTIKAQ